MKGGKQMTETQKVAATDLATLTVEIKFYLQQTGYHIIEAGKRLILAKEQVPHGEWANWLESNFSLSQETARNFMRVAERFGSNSKLIWNFKPTQMIKMLALPAGEEEDFIEAKKAEGKPVEEMTVKQLNEEIKRWKQRASKAEEDIDAWKESIKLAESQRDYQAELNQKLREAHEEQEKRIDGLLEQCADQSDDLALKDREISKLKDELGRKQPKIVPPADYEDLQREVKELRERPVEVVTELPKDYESLKEENAQLKDREEKIKGIYEVLSAAESISRDISSLAQAPNMLDAMQYFYDKNPVIYQQFINNITRFVEKLKRGVVTSANKMSREDMMLEIRNLSANSAGDEISVKVKDYLTSQGYKTINDLNDRC